jgi:hypothetical protein
MGTKKETFTEVTVWLTENCGSVVDGAGRDVPFEWDVSVDTYTWTRGGEDVGREAHYLACFREEDFEVAKEFAIAEGRTRRLFVCVRKKGLRGRRSKILYRPPADSATRETASCPTRTSTGPRGAAM